MNVFACSVFRMNCFDSIVLYSIDYPGRHTCTTLQTIHLNFSHYFDNYLVMWKDNCISEAGFSCRGIISKRSHVLHSYHRSNTNKKDSSRYSSRTLRIRSPFIYLAPSVCVWVFDHDANRARSCSSGMAWPFCLTSHFLPQMTHWAAETM